MATKMTQCPKCMSNDIFTRQGGIGWGVKLMVSGVGFGMRSTDDWVTYVCTACGYYENYLTNEDWLTKIQNGTGKSGWRRVE